MVEKKQCSVCKQVLPIEEFYPSPARKDGYQVKCKVCDKAYAAEHRRQIRLGLKQPKNTLMNMSNKHWKKTNPNHYPDSEWVWTQLENGVTGKQLYDKIDQKYTLSTHGNTGKTHTVNRNPWKNRK